jgi:tetratricopeptide (TPR) repeat protein
MGFIRKTIVVLGIVLLIPPGVSAQDVPITTSDEARELYIQGRDLAEKLRATDARRYYQRAVENDPEFALGYWALAVTAPTTKDFFEALERAVELADGASEGEHHVIMALDAAARGDPDVQREHLDALVSGFPADKRAHNAVGGFHFGRQEYDLAIAAYEKAIAIDSEFSQPYNQLGYAYRFQERFPDAERAFKKYTELIPDEPNPHDSYAELLMKLGRFEESIENYEKALEQDPNFVASYVGIANNQMFQDRPEAARSTLQELERIARTDGERRTALFWKAASYVHEEKTEEALEAVSTMYAIAEAKSDLGAMSGDQNLVGTILLESGDPDGAMSHYSEAIRLIQQADVPDDVKAATVRNSLFNQGRVALARRDLAAAQDKAREYSESAKQHGIPFEIRNSHELQGMVAVYEKDYESAVRHLKQANQQNPRVLYRTAVALHGAGDHDGSRAAMEAAANFNGLNFNYAYVRYKAKRKLEGS